LKRGGAARRLRRVSTSSNVLHGYGLGLVGAIGSATVLPSPPVVPHNEVSRGEGVDIARVRVAFDDVAEHLRGLLENLDGDLRDLVEVAVLFAEDYSFIEPIICKIQDGVPAATAVDQISAQFVRSFESAGGLLAERVSDLLSVRDRVVARLLEIEYGTAWEMASEGIVVSQDLSPADASLLPSHFVKGIITRDGGPTSHVAVLARQWGIPAVVGVQELQLGSPHQAGEVDANSISSGDVVGLSPLRGTIVIAPSIAQRKTLHEADRQVTQVLGKVGDTQPVVPLHANVSRVSEIDEVLGNSASGIGLFRSEAMFLNRSENPSIAEQEAIYEQLFSQVVDQKVVIRTLDAGSDKPLAFLPGDIENNPALGVRGIRTARCYPKILFDQLHAIANAGANAGSETWVMAPMVATGGEAQEFVAAARSFGIDHVGVMVEIPAAAVMADSLAELVDFISIGTNDLTQYVMAVDRETSGLSDLNTPWQPAVMRLIARVCSAGRRAGIDVSVCGEAAADPLMAIFLVGVGVADLSMAPTAIPLVRFVLTQISRSQCEKAAQAALQAASVNTARRAIEDSLSAELLTLLRPAEAV